MTAIDLRDRYQGCLLGLAAGDALGTTLEFTPHGRGGRPPLTTIVGGGPFNLDPGKWTDDTSMAICLAESLLAEGELAPKDLLERWVRWWRDGENSSTGRCFDIGGTTARALRRFVDTGELWAEADEQGSGNGPLMRLAPLALFVGPGGSDVAAQGAMAQAFFTHGGLAAGEAAAALGRAIALALRGDGKEEILDPEALTWGVGRSDLLAVLRGSFRRKTADQVRGTGYAVDCLEAALWAFWTTDSYADAVLAAANLGEDADTTAAVCGQLAGAYYGARAIPADWLAVLWEAPRLAALADGLLEAAEARGRRLDKRRLLDQAGRG